MNKTVAERLQMAAANGGLGDCRSWEDVARKLNTTSRVLRRIRATLGDGAPMLRDELMNARLSFAKTAEGRASAARHVQELDVDVSEWDEEPTQPGWSYPEAVNENWRAREEPVGVKKLTRAECPDGTLILWASDIHVPIHHEPVCRLMVECAERTGVSRVVMGGDGLDMNCLSKHAKESRRTVEHATILEEVEPGRWLLDWFASKETDWLLGNHEDRLKRFIDENPAFHGSVASNFAQMVGMPARINVLDGEVRLGNLSMFHGHHEFKNGTGGKYPAHKILDMFPDQSSIHGHLHRKATAYRTTRDEFGIPRTRRVWSMGHLSHEHMHYGYVSRVPNWQMGFGLIRAFWEDDRPRWSVYPIEVLFDRYNRPFFEFDGWVYR